MNIAHRFLMLGMVGSACLTGCSREDDPGMRERVSLLEAELNKKEVALKAARASADDNGSASKATANDAVVDPAKAKQTYLSAVEEAKEAFAKSLGKDGTVDRVSVFPVAGPDPDYPVTSKVGFSITAKNGKKFDVVVPMAASGKGEWRALDGRVIDHAIREAAAAESAAVAANQPASQPVNRPAPPPQKPTNPTDVMGANRTVEVGWGDEARPAQRPPAPPQQAPQPQPQKPAPSQPVKPMPSDRDVIIDFGN